LTTAIVSRMVLLQGDGFEHKVWERHAATSCSWSLDVRETWKL